MMRTKNWRMIIGGLIFAVLALLFFFGMMGMAGRSNDPAGMMQTVGEVSGVVGTIGIALFIAGLLGWQGLSKKS
jgi:hypothetical protein